MCCSGWQNVDYLTLLRIYACAFKLRLIVAVSVASCERSFSKLRLIKSYLRSRMGEDRHGLREKVFQAVRRPTLGPLASGILVETCIGCLYSNQNIDKTATILRFRNRLIVILATGLSLGLITEKLSLRASILTGTSTYRAWVRCTFCTPLVGPKDRLSALSIVSIENAFVGKLNFDDIIRNFRQWRLDQLIFEMSVIKKWPAYIF